ncbi:hypothetical protein RUM44_003360 [Polyplax serrata]|uniref:PDZ domain-containing protein n=1 Tax=Polyplax serrata TaxID=468196 RepID=A0ABR1AGD1_POLSC
MADEEFGDLNLTQYSVSGRWLQNSNTSWMRYSHGTNFDGPNPGSNVPERFTSTKSNCCEGDIVSGSICSRAPGSAGQTRSRSGLYYSPPGTSYTIVERPPAVPVTATINPVHQQYADKSCSQKYSSAFHQSRSLTHSPRASSKTSGMKRPMSPEEVLNMFGSTPGKGKPPVRRSHSSTASPTPAPRHHYLYQNTHDDSIIRTVTMVQQPESGHGFGVCIKGGKDSEDGRLGVYISRVEEGSVAERVGLKPGDFILEVNGTPFNTISHEEALKMLKSCRKLSMTIQSPNALSQTLPLASPASVQAGGQWLVPQSYSWMDREGRPVSPPLEYARAVPPTILAPRWVYPTRSKESGSTRKVDINIETGQSLGLMIRGGLEYNLGIFITGVDKDSVAERAGLMVGDQILEVNGQSFMDVTHDEAVNQLKVHKRMTLLVRDVGKVPHSCTAYDDHHWQPCFSNSSTDHVLGGKDYCPALQMVQEKARVLLSRNELLSLSYYQEEYALRHMTIEAFVTVLLELLNTPEKHNLLTELREVILPQDRVRFDDLVYRRAPIESDRHGLHRIQTSSDQTRSAFDVRLNTSQA